MNKSHSCLPETWVCESSRPQKWKVENLNLVFPSKTIFTYTPQRSFCETHYGPFRHLCLPFYETLPSATSISFWSQQQINTFQKSLRATNRKSFPAFNVSCHSFVSILAISDCFGICFYDVSQSPVL
jgi:hypothetical protein